MLYEKIFLAEQRMKSTVRVNISKLEILENIKEYVNRIDSETELLTIKNVKKLSTTISNLKGAALNDDEIELIHEVFDN